VHEVRLSEETGKGQQKGWEGRRGKRGGAEGGLLSSRKTARLVYAPNLGSQTPRQKLHI